MMAPKLAGRGALAAELAVIVLGVLIALAADSWWASRSDRARASGYLEALSVDFEQASQDLDAAVVGLEHQLEALRSFREIVQSNQPAPDSTPLPFLGGNARFFPPTGMIDALLTTGDITLLPQDVRLVLIRERAALERRIDQVDRFADLLVASLRDLNLPAEEIAVASASAGPLSARDVQRSPVVRTAYLNIAIGFSNQLGEHYAMQESVRAIRAAVDSARSNAG